MDPKVPVALVATRPVIADDSALTHPTTHPTSYSLPVRYTKGLHDQIVKLIETGQRPATAAAMCGLSRASFQKWMQDGKALAAHPDIIQFAEDVETATAQLEGKLVKRILDDELDTDNAKWVLERAFAENWNREAHLKVNAMLQKFLSDLQANLPPLVTQDMVGRPMFDIVIAAAAGHSVSDVPLLGSQEEG